MTESLTLFKTIVNSGHFNNAAIILFMNKCDLFAQKLITKPITSAFPEYTGRIITIKQYRKTNIKKK